MAFRHHVGVARLNNEELQHVEANRLHLRGPAAGLYDEEMPDSMRMERVDIEALQHSALERNRMVAQVELPNSSVSSRETLAALRTAQDSLAEQQHGMEVGREKERADGLVKELESVNSKHRTELEQLKEKMNREAHEKMSGALEKHNREVKALRDDAQFKDTTRKDLMDQLAGKEGYLKRRLKEVEDNLTSKHREEKAGLESRHVQEISKVRSEMSTLQSSEDVGARIAKANQEFKEKELKYTQDSYAEKQKELMTKQHEMELAKVKGEGSTALLAEKNELQTKLSSLQTQLENLSDNSQSNVVRLQKSLEEKEALATKQLTDQKTALGESHKLETDNILARHKLEREGLESQNRLALKNSKDKFTTTMSNASDISGEVTRRHQAALDNLDAQHRETVNRLENQHKLELQTREAVKDNAVSEANRKADASRAEERQRAMEEAQIRQEHFAKTREQLQSQISDATNRQSVLETQKQNVEALQEAKMKNLQDVHELETKNLNDTHREIVERERLKARIEEGGLLKEGKALGEEVAVGGEGFLEKLGGVGDLGMLGFALMDGVSKSNAPRDGGASQASLANNQTIMALNRYAVSDQSRQ